MSSKRSLRKKRDDSCDEVEPKRHTSRAPSPTPSERPGSPSSASRPPSPTFSEKPPSPTHSARPPSPTSLPLWEQSHIPANKFGPATCSPLINKQSASCDRDASEPEQPTSLIPPSPTASARTSLLTPSAQPSSSLSWSPLPDPEQEPLLKELHLRLEHPTFFEERCPTPRHRSSSPTTPFAPKESHFYFPEPEKAEEITLSSEPEFVPFNYDPTWQEQEEKDFDEFYEEELKYLDHSYSLDEKDSPVYEGAPITLCESLVSILTLALTFSLSGSCIQQLLQVINVHCRSEKNIFKKSLHLFKNFFAGIRGAVSYQYFCSTCFEECHDKKCTKCPITTNPICYLIKLPFLEQLQVLLKKEGFFSKLKTRNSFSSSYSDIYDGNVYKHYVKQGKLGLQSVLSFLWYTDGAAVFNSSKISVWPLFLIINELPFSERFKKENTLVPALWCGPAKPHANILLKALYSEMKELEKGVDMEVHDHGVQNIHGYIVAGTADLPARAAMLNSIAHNGESSCHRCYQPGEKREGCVGVQIFPYIGSDVELRRDDTFEREGDLALQMQKPYLGWKGMTLLSKLTLLPLSSTALDAMHLLFAGCQKKILQLLLDNEFSKLICNIKVHRAMIDERLVKIKPPHFLTRVPKPTLQLAEWKTSHLKSFCLYFSLPVLKGSMSDLYVRHFASFEAAIQLLNSECVSEESVKLAEDLIDKFLSFFEDMYGQNYLTLNFHLLCHLGQMVRDLGPLYVTSCFPLESINGEIMKMVHGTRFPESQIASSLNVCLALPEIVDNLKDSKSKDLCNNMLKPVKECKSIQIDSLTLIGDLTPEAQLPQDIKEELTQLGLGHGSVSSFHSLRKDKCLFVAVSHPKIFSRDSSCVQYIGEGVFKMGIIQKFYTCSQRVLCLLTRS